MSVALLDLDLATPAEANVVVRLAGQRDPQRLIAEKFELSAHALYGRQAEAQLSNPHAGRKWVKTLGNAFLGASSLHRFENASHLVKEIIQVSELTPRTIDSHKTVLQELASKRGLPNPVYSTLEESGPDHDRMFRVAVVVGRLRAEGEGTSKKRAEEAAARELLVRRMPGARNPAAVKVLPERPSSTFQFSRLPPRARRDLEELAVRLTMPRSAASLSRAFLHSSYAFEKGLRPEESNGALALLGSAVLSVWATRLQLVSLVGPAGDGRPEVLTTSPWDLNACAAAAEAIGVRRYLLTGRGERVPNQRILGEAFQALAGALFAELGEPAAIAELLPEALTVLRASFELGWLDAKTELGRRLGPSGIHLEYRHDKRGPDHSKEYIGEVTLASPELGQSIRVMGTQWEASKTAAEKAAAAMVMRAVVADLSKADGSGADGMARELQTLVARQECAVAPTIRAEVTQWFRRGALGTIFLRRERFDSFLAWAQLLGQLAEDQVRHLERFYRTCRESDAEGGRVFISEGSRLVVDWVNGLGLDQPALELLQTAQFRDLLELATLTRLSAAPTVLLNIRDEVEGFALLERTHGRLIEIGRVPDANILGVEGALPLMLSRVMDRMFDEQPAPSLHIDGNLGDDTLLGSSASDTIR